MPFTRATPDWVRRWWTARQLGDLRLFPEQIAGSIELHFWHGSPVGDLKDPHYPAGYEPELRITATHPTGDRDYFVQPDEYGLV